MNDPFGKDPNGLECVWDDGSFDSEDDPDTGNVGACQEQGGTWIELGGLFGDWSSSANGQLAQLASDIGSGLYNIISVTDRNGQKWVTRYDPQGRVQWTAGGGWDKFYSYFSNEVWTGAPQLQFDPNDNVANGYSQWLTEHPGLPMDLDLRYEVQMVQQMAQFGTLDPNMTLGNRICSAIVYPAASVTFGYGPFAEAKALQWTLYISGSSLAVGSLGCELF